MSYTTTELITRSWYLSSIVARDLETVSGDQLNDGLNMLNALLSFKTADQRLIPYYNEYDFVAVVGQEQYFIPNLILPETLTFFKDTVRYATVPLGRKAYFGTPRAEGIESLMFQCHYERCLKGSNLFVYFLPDQNYPMTIWGKFSLQSVSLGQDLSLTLDAFYIEYLRYALSQYMCQEYNISMSADTKAKLDEFERMIFDISPIDMSTTTRNFFSQQGSSPDIYGFANLGRGWTP